MIELLLSVIEEPNEIHKYCMSKHDHGQAGRLVSRVTTRPTQAEIEELRQFLKENPHYNIQVWLCRMENKTT